MNWFMNNYHYIQGSTLILMVIATVFQWVAFLKGHSILRRDYNFWNMIVSILLFICFVIGLVRIVLKY